MVYNFSEVRVMEWEYRLVRVDALSQELLNSHGADGFELIQIISTKSSDWLMIFKKPVKK
ncbi:conserved hypothetical protein [Candidatus Sulfotelmatobacter kueseliae]|uniref:DUF4177 domain-containing protein n=1 Tax=Candidatus Sulfotelmatobacter kueseliae TaxID=2042962 RepID=A0A2U3KYJ0_9BACT|nr:conserved hypothetical protein [Candidatus Sulfotelmatobacter kueseliae]